MLTRLFQRGRFRQRAIIAVIAVGIGAAVGLALLAVEEQNEARRASAAQREIQKLNDAVGRGQLLAAGAVIDAVADQRPDSRDRVRSETWRKASSEWRNVTDAYLRLQELTPSVYVDRVGRALNRVIVAATRVATLPIQREFTQDAIKRVSAIVPPVRTLATEVTQLGVEQQRRSEIASRRASIAFLISFGISIAVITSAGLASLLFYRRRRRRLREQVSIVERRSEQRVRALIEHSGDVVVVVDPSDHQVLWVAASIERLIGLDARHTIGRDLWEVVHPADIESFKAGLKRCCGREGHEMIRARIRHRDGRWVWSETIAEDHSGDPSVEGLLLSIRDVTERKHLEDRLRRQAFHDTLTGLGNRALMEEKLSVALRTAIAEHNKVGVLHLDIDDFKTINDSLGQSSGDELLRAVGRRIDSAIDSRALATRLGADEFAVLLTDADGEEEAIEVAERILEVLSPPFGIRGRELRIGTSIGIVVDDGSTGVVEMLRNADLAVNEAKTHSRRVCLFEQHFHDRVVDRLELGGEIERGIGEGQFRLLYQPIVELKGQTIAGIETLVRWDHPTRGLLGPDRFVGLAEENGSIRVLGRWVLEQACFTAARLVENDGLRYVSVNVSIRQLESDNFVDQVTSALKTSGLPAHCLVLEITETMLIEDREVAAVQLGRLKELGLRIAIDDFGVGHSVLAYLQEMPIDLLKIDRSFIDRMHVDEGRVALTEGIIDLARRLDLYVVAEGVEEPVHAEILRASGAHYGQGYLFSRPVPIEEIERGLRAPQLGPLTMPNTRRSGGQTGHSPRVTRLRDHRSA